MFGLPFAHRGEKVVAVADIGSDGVGVCIAKLRPDGPALVLSAERALLRFEERTTEQTISGILALLGEVCDKIISDYARLQAGRDEATPKDSKLPTGQAPHLSAAVAVIKTPWSDSKTSRVATKFEQEERITDDIIRELARQALEMEKDKPLLFEASVARIELNGYPTKKPAGKYARTVEVAALLSECEPAIRDGVLEVLRRTFPGASISLASGTRALLSVFHDWPSRARDHFVIDMAGDSANCVVIRKDIAAEHVVVPEGVRTILKRVAGAGMAEEKLSLLRMVLRDACSGAACDELDAALSRAEQELARIFGEAFGRLASARKLPNDLILVAEPDFAPRLVKFFSRVDFGQFTASTRPFAPRAFAQNEIQDLAAPGAGISIEPGLAVAVGFVNSEEGLHG